MQSIKNIIKESAYVLYRKGVIRVEYCPTCGLAIALNVAHICPLGALIAERQNRLSEFTIEELKEELLNRILYNKNEREL